MESALVEVLILNGLGADSYYKVVTDVVLKILRVFEGRRGGDA